MNATDPYLFGSQAHNESIIYADGKANNSKTTNKQMTNLWSKQMERNHNKRMFMNKRLDKRRRQLFIQIIEHIRKESKPTRTHTPPQQVSRFGNWRPLASQHKFDSNLEATTGDFRRRARQRRQRKWNDGIFWGIKQIRIDGSVWGGGGIGGVWKKDDKTWNLLIETNF